MTSEYNADLFGTAHVKADLITVKGIGKVGVSDTEFLYVIKIVAQIG